jgi:hypothetical protein
VLPFGDSITYGGSKLPLSADYEGVDYSGGGGWRIGFWHRAGVDGKRVELVGSQMDGPAMAYGEPFPKAHEGHPGYTVEDEAVPGGQPREGIAPLLDPPDSVVTTYRPDIVLLMIGTNNIQYDLGYDEAPAQVGALIDKIAEQDDHVLVLVATILPTRHEVAPAIGDVLDPIIEEYNAALGAVVESRAAAGKHVALVDMHGAFVSQDGYEDALMNDNVHPNPPGYLLMGDIWYEAVRDLLR